MRLAAQFGWCTDYLRGSGRTTNALRRLLEVSKATGHRAIYYVHTYRQLRSVSECLRGLAPDDVHLELRVAPRANDMLGCLTAAMRGLGIVAADHYLLECGDAQLLEAIGCGPRACVSEASTCERGVRLHPQWADQARASRAWRGGGSAHY